MYTRTNSQTSLLSNSVSWPSRRHLTFFFRMGYLSIAVVYALTGYLALAAAMGWGGRITDHEGALEIILGLPYGGPMLLLITIGILGYVSFRFAQAFLNIEGKEKNWKGYMQRAYEAGAGIMYSLLAWAAFQGFLKHDIKHKDDSEKLASAEVMSLDGGDYLLFALAAALFAASFLQIYKGFTGQFLKEFRREQLKVWEWRLLSILGRLGLVVRGFSFALFGYYLMKVIWSHNPAYAKGSKEVLAVVYRQPYGRVWLAIAACGFISYALYCAMSAKARKFR